jgi:hypothetical protein
MASITNFLNKNLKIKGGIGNVLHNQFVLYFFAFMAVIDLMYFASSGDIRSLVTLLIVGFLSSFFSKNMIVILFIALVVTHIIKFGTTLNEGMDNQTSGSIGSKKKGKKSSNSEVTNSESEAGDEGMSQPKGKKSDVSLSDLKGELSDFQSIQDKILGGMKEIDPLLSKAEAFIEKFDRYKASNKIDNFEGKADDDDDEEDK